MKNTIENKARFFAQYWGQEVAIHCNNLYYVNAIMDKIGEHYYLELTPLSQITDEDLDAIEFRFLRGRDMVKIIFNGIEWSAYTSVGSYFAGKGHLLPKHVDYLRRKEYALPFDGITVDELIEFGWIKLKTK